MTSRCCLGEDLQGCYTEMSCTPPVSFSLWGVGSRVGFPFYEVKSIVESKRCSYQPVGVGIDSA